jgi:aminopeptidase N
VNGVTASWQGFPQPDRIRVVLPRGLRAEVELAYHGTIKSPTAGLFVGYICDKSVYLLENSQWLFTPLTKNSEAIRVSGSITAPQKLTVATPGQCDSVGKRDATRVWSYRATTTSLNLGVFASDYRILRARAGDMDVEFYVSSRHEEAMRAARLDKYAQGILEHYQATIGPYPFEGWPVKVVEVPIYKPGGHSSLNVVTLAENMLHRRPPVTPTDEILFLTHDLKLIAHELAHQWWGSGVEVADQDEWTSEGLTEYTVYRYYADKHPGTATEFIVRSWQTCVDADRNNYYVRHPELLKNMRPEFAEQVASGSLATRVYNAMPLKLIQAERYLGGEVFQEKLSAVYRNHCRGVLHLDQFLAETDLTEEVLVLD